jgi:hypothetical protein
MQIESRTVETPEKMTRLSRTYMSRNLNRSKDLSHDDSDDDPYTHHKSELTVTSTITTSVNIAV